MICVCIIFGALFIQYAATIDMQCELYNDNWDIVGNIFTCKTKNFKIKSSDNRKITSVNGGTSNNQNVKGFYVSHGIVRYFPLNLATFFPNINAIWLDNNGLREIHQSDLSPFGTKLEEITIYANHIEYLEKGLFDKNPNLKAIEFSNNRIRAVHEKVFDNFVHLKTLSMHTNYCTDQIDFSSDLATTISEIKRGCSKRSLIFISNGNENTANDELDELIASVSLTQNACQKCAKSFDAYIDSLEIKQKLDELQSNINESQMLCSVEKLKITDELMNIISQNAQENRGLKIEQKLIEISEKLTENSIEGSKLSEERMKLVDQNGKLQAEIDKLKDEIHKLKTDSKNLKNF